MIKNDKMRKSVWMLATAVAAFMSSCLHAELAVLEELDAAEAARGDWKVAAQHYINAFEKFHGGNKAILERNGGKLFKGYIIRLCLRYGEKTGPILSVCLQYLS